MPLPAPILGLNLVNDSLIHALRVSSNHTRLQTVCQEVHLHLVIIYLFFEHRQDLEVSLRFYVLLAAPSLFNQFVGVELIEISIIHELILLWLPHLLLPRVILQLTDQLRIR